MARDARTRPEWPTRIDRLLREQTLTQAALAGELGVSTATVSRWMRGSRQPSGEAYMSLGNLARPPDNLYFWERAGLDITPSPRAGQVDRHLG